MLSESVAGETSASVVTQMTHFKRGILIGIALLMIYTFASAIIAFKKVSLL